MKKWLIGSLVGAILIFLWQFLSWTVLNLHQNAARYHPEQQSIVDFLSSKITEDGAYMLPTAPPGTPMSEHENLMKQAEGKPWASVIYHKSLKTDMVRPMIRGFLVDIALVILLIFMITRAGIPAFGKVVGASLAAGFFAFLLHPYTGHNWFALPLDMILPDFYDAIIGWGLVGLWLGWWLNRK